MTRSEAPDPKVGDVWFAESYRNGLDSLSKLTVTHVTKLHVTLKHGCGGEFKVNRRTGHRAGDDSWCRISYKPATPELIAEHKIQCARNSCMQRVDRLTKLMDRSALKLDDLQAVIRFIDERFPEKAGKDAG